jgi:hypothetical protein
VQRRLLIGILGLGTLAAATTAVLGFVLADVYRPDDPDAAWRDWQLAAAVAFLVASAAAVLLGMLRHSLPVALCGLVATAGALVTLVTWPLVAWDLVGLRAVTVGTDVSGYWTAASDDQVVLVINGGTELSPGEYAVALLAHLAAPVLGAAALLFATVMATRSVHRTGRHEATAAPAVA